MYEYIVNPRTGRQVSVYGKLGQSVIRNYLSQIGGSPKKTYSSYSCKLGDKGVDNVEITTDNCESQWDSSGVPGLSRCKLTAKNVCRKRQNTSKKRASKNLAKLKSALLLAKNTQNREVVQQIVKPGTTANVFLINCDGWHDKGPMILTDVEFDGENWGYKEFTGWRDEPDVNDFIDPSQLEGLSYDEQTEVYNNAEKTPEFQEAKAKYDKQLRDHRSENERIKKEKFNELLQKILKSKGGSKIKEGDLVEDCEESGYRTGGVYLVYKNADGELELGDLDTEADDYGHIGAGFSLGPKYPPGYWTNAPFLKAYWHGGPDQFEPVSREIWSNITINNLVEVSKEEQSYVRGEGLVTKYYSKVVYNWGTLEFPGKKEEVIDKLNKLKTYKIRGKLIKELFFQPIEYNTSILAEDEMYTWQNL